MNSRKDLRNGKGNGINRILYVLLGVVLSLAVIGVIFIVVIAKPSHDSQSESATSSVSSSKAASTTSTKSSSSSSSAAASSSMRVTVTVTNYQSYSRYDGEYYSESGMDGYWYDVDFSSGTVTMLDSSDWSETFHFDKVLRHEDGTLVINTHRDNRDYGQHVAFLFAPSDRKVTRNWQINSHIDDLTDISTPRLSPAQSADSGKTFDMAPAYHAFATNQTALTDGEATSTVFTLE